MSPLLFKEHSLFKKNIVGFPKQLSKLLVRTCSSHEVGGVEIYIGERGNILNFPKDISPRVNSRACLISVKEDGSKIVDLVKGRVYWKNDESVYEAKVVDQDGVIVGEDNMFKRILG